MRNYNGDVQAFHDFGFDSLKLDSCGAQKNMQLWSDLLPGVLLENCR